MAGAHKITSTSVEHMLKHARKGVTIEIADVTALAPRTDDRIKIVRQIFDKGAHIATADGVKVTPDQAEILIAGMASRKRVLSPGEAARRGGWNKVDQAERDRCLAYWQDHDLSVKQLEKYTQRSYSALRNWFADEFPRPDKRGRPRKRKGQ